MLKSNIEKAMIIKGTGFCSDTAKLVIEGTIRTSATLQQPALDIVTPNNIILNIKLQHMKE